MRRIRTNTQQAEQYTSITKPIECSEKGIIASIESTVGLDPEAVWLDSGRNLEAARRTTKINRITQETEMHNGKLPLVTFKY